MCNWLVNLTPLLSCNGRVLGNSSKQKGVVFDCLSAGNGVAC